MYIIVGVGGGGGDHLDLLSDFADAHAHLRNLITI